VLWKLAQHVRVYGWWPSAPQLVERLRRGSRWTIRRDLNIFERAGLVVREGRSWSITADGWAWLGVPAIAPRHPRKPKALSKKERRAQRRRDAQRALAALKE